MFDGSANNMQHFSLISHSVKNIASKNASITMYVYATLCMKMVYLNDIASYNNTCHWGQGYGT